MKFIFNSPPEGSQYAKSGSKNIRWFEADNLFAVGRRRNNSRRKFLFISRMLGKHIEVKPDVVRVAGFLLSCIKYGKDPSPYVSYLKNPDAGEIPAYTPVAIDQQLVIGFCETATGLGMAVASSIEGCCYQTTTRENIENLPQLLSFEEEHSHASTHRMFSGKIQLSGFKKLILVDDEITTGKSILNLMRQIEAVSHMEEYSILTILDWRDEEQKKAYAAFEKEFHVSIKVYSAADGTITDESVDDTGYPQNETRIPVSSAESSVFSFSRETVAVDGKEVMMLSGTGRTGINYDSIIKTETEASHAADRIVQVLGTRKKVLVVGHGENIYIPSRVASYLDKYGIDAYFKTTTLSPVAADGKLISDIAYFYDRGKKYYFYNRNRLELYDAVILVKDFGDMPVLCSGGKFSVFY